MGGYDNKTSREISDNRRRGGRINAIKSGRLYEKYMADEKAQYIMNFFEYKKKHKLYERYLLDMNSHPTMSFYEYEQLCNKSSADKNKKK